MDIPDRSGLIPQRMDHGQVGFLSCGNGDIGADLLQQFTEALANSAPAEDQNSAVEQIRQLFAQQPDGAFGCDGGIIRQIEGILQKIHNTVRFIIRRIDISSADGYGVI